MKQPNAVDPPPKRSGGHEEIRAIYHETRGRAQSVEKIIISVDDATDSSDKCAFIKFVKKRGKRKNETFVKARSRVHRGSMKHQAETSVAGTVSAIS